MFGKMTWTSNNNKNHDFCLNKWNLQQWQLNQIQILINFIIVLIAQSAGAVEYTGCFSAEG